MRGKKNKGAGCVLFRAVACGSGASGVVKVVLCVTTLRGGWVVRTSSAGASYNFEYSRARAYCACSRCGWGLFGHFYSHLSFSSLSPSLWETARYRLKYCLKGSLNPKQPTNQCYNTDPIPVSLCFKQLQLDSGILSTGTGNGGN